MNSTNLPVDGGWIVGADGYEDMVLHGGRLIFGASFEIRHLDPLTGQEVFDMEEAGDGPGRFEIHEGNLVYADEDEEFEYGPASAATVWPNGRGIHSMTELPASIAGHGITVSITDDQRAVTIKSQHGTWQVDPVPQMVPWGAYISTGWLFVNIADERLAGIDLSKPIGDTLVQLGLTQP